MKILHPDGKHTLVMQDGTQLIGDVEIAQEVPGWVSIGYIGGNSLVIIEREEWGAFKALVDEIGEAITEDEALRLKNTG